MECGPCPQPAPQGCRVADAVSLPSCSQGCPVLLLPARASAGSPLPGRGCGCLRRAQPQRLPGWQARGAGHRATRQPRPPAEAPLSPARAAASSVEPAGLRSRLLLRRQRMGLGPGCPPQPGGERSPGRSPNRCHPLWPHWLQQVNRVQMWRQSWAPACD